MAESRRAVVVAAKLRRFQAREIGANVVGCGIAERFAGVRERAFIIVEVAAVSLKGVGGGAALGRHHFKEGFDAAMFCGQRGNPYLFKCGIGTVSTI